MLNLALGTQSIVGDATVLQTRRAAVGHAVYGPYVALEPGRYTVDFVIEGMFLDDVDSEETCAVLDVTSDYGKSTFARRSLACSEVRVRRGIISLKFEVSRTAEFEFRVHVTGTVPLIVHDNPQVILIGGAEDERDVPPDGLLPPNAFPLPTFYLQHAAEFARIRDNGGHLTISGGAITVSIDGVVFHANNFDDIRFVEEIFFRSTYNILSSRKTCIIDVGTNIGLVALSFAAKQFVEEVHTFEPFTSTYERALANIALNPRLGPKINARNYGLAGADAELTVLIADDSDSGMQSIAGWGRGRPESISVRDAGSTLAPIIASARARGLAVVAKVDCEGSEFSIFETLRANGLMHDIHGLMVEWHRLFDDKDQHTLIGPLLDAGFMVFDQSGKQGNGFFYAVRS